MLWVKTLSCYQPSVTAIVAAAYVKRVIGLLRESCHCSAVIHFVSCVCRYCPHCWKFVKLSLWKDHLKVCPGGDRACTKQDTPGVAMSPRIDVTNHSGNTREAAHYPRLQKQFFLTPLTATIEFQLNPMDSGSFLTPFLTCL